MNLFIFVVLGIMEIITAVISVTKKTDVKTYCRVRVITDAAELLLFAVTLFTREVSLGLRFNGLFILLILRAVLALIRWLMKRNSEKEKNNRRKKIPAIIVSMIISVFLFLGALAPSFMFNDYEGLPTTGRYAVKMTHTILVDESRVEEFENDGSKREVPIYIFYPDVAEEELTTFAPFPVIFFSHGAFGYYPSNVSTYMELASNGYLVISIEHPYHSMFTKDTDGKTIMCDKEFFNGAMTIGNSDNGVTEEEIFETTGAWMKLRIDDMNFAIDTVKSGDSTKWHSDDPEEINRVLKMADFGRIGLMGHSLGGAAAVTVGRMRDDVSAVIDIDGTMLGEITGVEDGQDVINTEPYPIPLLSFDSESHHNDKAAAKENGQLYANNVIHENAVCGFETCIKGSAHMDYTDLPLISPFIANLLGKGSVDTKSCMTKVNEITLDFFNTYVKKTQNSGTMDPYNEFTVEDVYELSGSKD